MGQRQGCIMFSILLLGRFVFSSAFCWILHLSMYIIDGKIAGRVAQSCLSCHFCLNLTWQLDRSCFHCLKWGGGEMGGGFLKKTIYTYFSACWRLLFVVVWARKHLITQSISGLEWRELDFLLGTDLSPMSSEFRYPCGGDLFCLSFPTNVCWVSCLQWEHRVCFAFLFLYSFFIYFSFPLLSVGQ